MHSISLGITFGLIALFSAGFANFLIKIPCQKIGPNKLIFYRNIFSTIFLTIILFLTLDQTNFSPKYIFITIGLSAFGYIPMYYFYKAAAIGKIGLVSPITSIDTLIAVLLALAIFNESLSGIQFFAIAGIIVGIVLLSIDLKQFKSSDILKISSGVPYALIAAFGWGIWMVLIKFPVNHLGPYLTSLIIEAGAMVFAFFIMKKSKTSVALDDKKMLLYIIPISLFMVLWSLAYYQGIRIANVSVVLTLSSASPLIVTLLGRFFYKERLDKKQYFSIGLILIGVILLSMK